MSNNTVETAHSLEETSDSFNGHSFLSHTLMIHFLINSTSPLCLYPLTISFNINQILLIWNLWKNLLCNKTILKHVTLHIITIVLHCGLIKTGCLWHLFFLQFYTQMEISANSVLISTFQTLKVSRSVILIYTSLFPNITFQSNSPTPLKKVQAQFKLTPLKDDFTDTNVP